MSVDGSYIGVENKFGYAVGDTYQTLRVDRIVEHKQLLMSRMELDPSYSEPFEDEDNPICEECGEVESDCVCHSCCDDCGMSNCGGECIYCEECGMIPEDCECC